MIAIELALHGEGLFDTDAAGASAGVDIKFGAGADVEVDAAGAGFETPVGGGNAVDLDVSGASAGAERGGHDGKTKGAGAGLGVDVSGCDLDEFDVSGAGLEVGCSVDAAGTDGAGAGVCLERDRCILDFDISGSRGGHDAGGARYGDVIVDAEVAVEIAGVALTDGDVVAGLDDGRVLGDLLDAGCQIAAATIHPAVVGMDVTDDMDLVVRARVEMDGAGSGGDVNAGGSGEGEGTVEVAILRKGSCGGKDEGRNE